MRDHGVEAALAAVGRGVAADDLESRVLEFKAPDPSLKKTYAVLADAAVCFANADGGTIVLGVAEGARTREDALVGVPDAYTPDGVRTAVFERTRPHLMVFVDERVVDGARVLVIDVPPGVTPCSTSAGTATRRLGDRCLPFTPDQQRELLIARGQLDWSAQPSGVGAEALSRLELGRLRDYLIAAEKEDLAEQDDRRLLTSLRLLTPDGRASHACLLLLGREDVLAEIVPMHGYSFQYRPTGGSEATTRIREQRPVLAALERTLDLII
jgi:ATP-dependent DNA helicase RecG